MNCARCQRMLLRLEDLGSPPPRAAAHLAVCQACRLYRDDLARIEANVPRLPTPASARKAHVVRLVLEPAASPPPAPSAAQPLASPAPAEPGMGRWAIVAAAAAILIATGIWLGNWAARTLRPPSMLAKASPTPERKKSADDSKTPADRETKSLAAAILECDLELAETRDAARRVEVLARLADSLRDESSWLARASAEKELRAIVRLHGRVVREGLVPRARDLALADRRATLSPIADGLRKSHLTLKALAPKVDAVMVRPLEELALAADSTAKALSALIDEATP